MRVLSAELADLQWRKARRSVNNGACVEAAAANGYVVVRDTVDRKGASVKYSGGAWRTFVANARVGSFDLDRL
jgi:Domain of unknown function (DUF397)